MSGIGMGMGYICPVATIVKWFPERRGLLVGGRAVLHAAGHDRAFARAHLDDAVAQQSMLKGLAGSGWHLCSIMMRMMFDGFMGRTASLGSPGVNEGRWMAPLRPGDDLTLDVDVAEARPSRSRPDTGIVTLRSTVRNASGQALCEMVSPIIVGRRAGVSAGLGG